MAKITNNDIPFLFLSGLKDEIVPAEMMRTMFAACQVQEDMAGLP